MILEFSITNFRSIKETTIFSMVAESSKARIENVTIHQLSNDKVRLLNSAVIYGANGSGKSNLIRAFYYLLELINNSGLPDSDRKQLKAGDKIFLYEPFRFDENTKDQPTSFSLTFIGPGNIKHKYDVSYNAKEIINEKLSFYPNGEVTNLFERPFRKDANELIHYGKLGSTLNNREISVFHNQLLLAKFGESEPDTVLTNIYVGFKNYSALNSHNPTHKSDLIEQIDQNFVNDESFQNQLNELVRRSDVKVNAVVVKSNLTETDAKKSLRAKKSYSKYSLHDLYKGEEKIGEENLSFYSESIGTQNIFLLGGKILDTLNKGGVLLVDELETSLHPDLCKMLIDLFHSENTNPKGAQLIFTTHAVTLLSKSMFRKDQIWFTEKDDTGKTDLFSVQDFKDVGEDIPFDRWYMAGKFGALPFIKMIDDASQTNEK